jgi:antimicrobial peptide system SdpB family protein
MWSQFRVVSAIISMALIKVQISWLYLQSGIAKLGQTAWLDGTAMYYWARNGTWGAATWSRDTVYWLTSQPIFEAGMTWGPIVIEVAAGISLLLRYGFRRIILYAGISLHLLVGLMMGLWCFSIIMWGCLIFLLIPFGRLRGAPPEECNSASLQRKSGVSTVSQGSGVVD